MKNKPRIIHNVLAKSILNDLRWKEDMVITNYNNERAWLKPCLDDSGKRIGITDCCLESDPCDRHSTMYFSKPS